MTQQNKNVPKLRFPEFSGEWDEYKLGKITQKVGSGSTPKGGREVYQNTGIPFIRSQNVNHNKLICNDLTYIPETTHEKMKGSKVLPSDILLNITGASIGRSCVVPSTFLEGNVNQHVCIIRTIKGFQPKFIQSILSSYNGQKLIMQSQAGGGREGLNFENVRGFKLQLPKELEQQKIAEFLSAVDERVDGLRRKKELLEHYKKGVMQKIFSQEIRFTRPDGSAFPDWKEKKLSEIGYFYYGKGAPKSTVSDDGKTPCVRYGELYSTYAENIKTIKSKTTANPSSLKLSKGGEVLVPRVGETAIDFCMCSYLPFSGVAIGEMISVFNTEENGLFYSYYFNTLKATFARYVEGGSVSNLYFRYLEPLKIQTPQTEEQELIADFLTSVDEKIEAVAGQLEQAQTFKKGLLQQMFV